MVNKKNFSFINSSGKQLILQNLKWRNLLAKSDSFTPISKKSFAFNAIEYFWAFVRFPSRTKSGAGYCGGGFEDYIFLFNLDKKSVHAVDRYLTQSCLKNVKVDIDSIEDRRDMNEKILFDAETGQLTFRQGIVDNANIIEKNIQLSPSASRIVYIEQ
ncbi:MAG: hypothetical protein KGM99_08465 [Burkholderiales bacterium]|nr:hypothetical protein [Burkholderiales bacterium]